MKLTGTDAEGYEILAGLVIETLGGVVSRDTLKDTDAEPQLEPSKAQTIKELEPDWAAIVAFWQTAKVVFTPFSSYLQEETPDESVAVKLRGTETEE